MLMVYARPEDDFDPDDPGPLLEAYCGACSRKIEEAHQRHEQDVEAFRDELNRGKPYC